MDKVTNELDGYKILKYTGTEDLTGIQVNNLMIIGYVGESSWLTQCVHCGKLKTVRGYYLKDKSAKCGCTNHSKNDLIGNTFGDITVISSFGRGRYECRCTCGEYKIMAGSDIRRGRGIKCNHFKEEERKKMIGRRFGDLKVIDYKGEIYTCECVCRNKIEIPGSLLKNGNRTSCGCKKTRQTEEMIGKKFGELTIIEYLGNSTYLCRCSCGNKVELVSGNLNKGCHKSCGCKSAELMRESKDRLLGKTRTDEQLRALDSREDMLEFINRNFTDRNPTMGELSSKLNINLSNTARYIDMFELRSHITSGEFISVPEEELCEYVTDICDKYNIKVVRHNKKLLNGKELDIYIPDLKIAIEFNGIYWHSSLKKDEYYHQNKTIDCARLGVRLIHIFEYEWEDNQQGIKNYLNHIIENKISGGTEDKTYLGDIKIENNSGKIELKSEDSSLIVQACEIEDNKVIIEKTYIKDWSYATSFISTCMDKLKEKYKNIIYLVDISKYTGNWLLKQGFINDEITEPGYTCIEKSNMDRNSRYVDLDEELNLSPQQLSELGLYKIYNCGYLRMVYQGQ